MSLCGQLAAQKLDRRIRERHNGLGADLHSLARHDPKLGVEIGLVPVMPKTSLRLNAHRMTSASDWPPCHRLSGAWA
jgi:hypothetical protein